MCHAEAYQPYATKGTAPHLIASCTPSSRPIYAFRYRVLSYFCRATQMI
jgi:hypothetical protein